VNADKIVLFVKKL